MVRRILIVGSQVRTVHSGVGTYAAMILRGLSERAVEGRLRRSREALRRHLAPYLETA